MTTKQLGEPRKKLAEAQPECLPRLDYVTVFMTVLCNGRRLPGKPERSTEVPVARMEGGDFN